MSSKNIYTAKVVSQTAFEDTNSISVLAVLKTCNGKPIEDVWVSKSFNANAEKALELSPGTEFGFKATGRSKEPTRVLDQGTPVHAIVGLDAKSLEILLPGEVVTEEAAASEATIKRRQGLATRALDFMSKLLTGDKVEA